MINIGEKIRDLRLEYQLSQAQLARAVFVEPASISYWENSKRLPDWYKIEQVLNVFGHTLDVKCVEKPDIKRDKSFYMEKSCKEIMNMSHEDLVDYIFITQNDYIIANICGLDASCVDIISMLPLEKLKSLISDRVESADRLTIFFKIEVKYYEIEQKVVDFMKEVKSRLKRIALDKPEVVEQVEYIDVDVDFEENGCHYFSDIKFLDKHLKALDITVEEINKNALGNNLPLDCCVESFYTIGSVLKMLYLYPNSFLK